MTERLPLADAAERLGLSVVAARRRAQRGTLPAEKIAGEWYVTLTDRAAQRAEPRAAQRDGTDSTDGKPGGTALLEHVTAERDRLAAVVQVLTTQLDAKDRQIEAKDRQIGELHVLLQQAQRALPSAVVEELTTAATAEPPEDPEPPHRPWWAFWRREGKTPQPTG